MNIPNILSNASSYLTSQLSSTLATVAERANTLLAYYKDSSINTDAFVTLLSKVISSSFDDEVNDYVLDDDDFNDVLESIPDGIRTCNDTSTHILTINCDDTGSLQPSDKSDLHADRVYVSYYDNTDSQWKSCVYDDDRGNHIVRKDSVEQYLGTSIENITSDLAVNGTLISLCEKSLNLIVNDDFSIATLTASMGGNVSEFGSSCSDFFYQISDSYTTGGVSAVVSLFTDLLSNFSRATAVNGVLQFTDNSHYVTTAFNAGIVSGLVTTMSGIATAIVTVVAPVIGIITGLIGMIVGGIVGAIDAATKADTYAYLKGDASVMAYPMGYFQLHMTQVPQNVQYLIQETGICRINIPGGFLLIGYGDAQRSTFNCEVHVTPSVLHASVLSYLNPDMNQLFYYNGNPYTAWAIDNPSRLIKDGTLDLLDVFNADLEEAEDYWRNTYSNLSQDEQDNAIKQSLVASMIYVLVSLITSQETQYGDKVASIYINGDTVRGFAPICILGKLIDMYTQMTRTNPAPAFPQWSEINTSSADLNAWQVNAWACLRANLIHAGAMSEDDFYLNDLYYFTDAEYAALKAQSTAGQAIMANILAHRTDDEGSYDTFMDFRDQVASAIDQDKGEVTVGLTMPVYVLKDFGINIPKYNRANVALTIAAELIAVIAITGITVVAAFKIRSACRKWAARRSANLERAWNQATRADEDGGTEESRAEGMAKYQSLRWKNNLISTIFGGTKYSKSGFWNSDETSNVSDKLPGVSDERLGYELYELITGKLYQR